ncbi:MAG: restriction endonuclease subunit S [Treponema sp.]|nr:restriction endonuclease subunit S [Treponema sp.]
MVEICLLKSINFVDLEKWYVEYYLREIHLKSKYELITLKKIISPKKNLIKKDDYKGDIPIVDKIVFKTGDIVFRKEKKTGMNLYSLDNEDLLVSNINFHQGATALNTFGKIVASTHYQPYSINTEIIDPIYLVKILRSEPFLKMVSGKKAQGIKNESGYDFIGNFKIPVPSISEQKAIIQKYQDTISKAEAIEKEANFLLNDSHLYFDSLLQIEEIKPSFVSGLNFIHYKNIDLWGIDKNLCRKTIRNKKYKTVPLENLCSVGSGGTPSRNHSEYYRDGNIPWIKTTEVIDEIISDTEEKITQKGLENSSAKLYEANSLIIAMYGQGKTRGRTAKLKVRATTNQACAVLYDINENLVNIDYLWFYFQNEYERIRELASGNNQPNLNAGMIKTYPIVLPPLPVQNEIVEHINQIKAQVKDLRQQAKELREKAKLEFERSVFE